MNILTIRIILASLLLLVVPTQSSNATVDCPDKWEIVPSNGETLIIDSVANLEKISTLSGLNKEKIQKTFEFGQKYIVVKNYSNPLPKHYFSKIKEGGRNIDVSGQWMVSLDGLRWRGLSAINGDLLPNPLPMKFENEPPQSLQGDRIFDLAIASRIGLAPSMKLSLEVTVNVLGCKPKVFYEQLSIIPDYKISTTSLDFLIDTYYKVNPDAKQINFLTQQRCNSTLNSFISHLKQISNSSQIWTIKNTKRGVLDLAWTLSPQENLDCFSTGLPFFDLSLSPSTGDSCFTLTTPFKSVFTYKTLRTPCWVSVDLNSYDGYGTFEVAKFQITGTAPPTTKDSVIKKLKCVKGKLSKTVTGQNPKCPSGFKPV